nr:DUF1127 domain-containing protein [Rhizobium sp. 007]
MPACDPRTLLRRRETDLNLQAWQNAVVRSFEKRKTRRSLLELTAAQLNDIGVRSQEARAEASKFWFWQ